MKTLSGLPQRHLSVAQRVQLLVALLGTLLFAMLSNVSLAVAVTVPQEKPAAVVAASYQAMDTAMNAGNAIHHPEAAAQPVNTLLLPSQTRVNASIAGTALYNYDLTRITAFRSWVARYIHDYSAINVWSTFQAQNVSTQGSVSQIIGDETLHIDETLQNDGQQHTMSPRKAALMAKFKNTNSSIEAGQTNHSTALIHHTVTLNQVNKTWLIESDQYTDPLELMYQPDHKTLAQPAATLQPKHPLHRPKPAAMATSYNYVYNRQAAINYANAWTYSCDPNVSQGCYCDVHSCYLCNPVYNCYLSSGNDCANFVSQALYDVNGGNIPGDYNNWYSIPGVGTTVDFVNAPGLYNYITNNPDGSAYVLDSDHQPEATDYSTAQNYDFQYEAPGDVIFYDWAPISGDKNHVTISVSARSDTGYTFVDSHTPNLNHWGWDLGWYPPYGPVGFFFVELGDYGLSVAPQ